MNEFAVNNQQNDPRKPEFGDRGYTGDWGPFQHDPSTRVSKPRKMTRMQFYNEFALPYESYEDFDLRMSDTYGARLTTKLKRDA